MNPRDLVRVSLALTLAIVPTAAAESLADDWDAIYLSGQKAGYAHAMTDRVEAGGQTVLHTRASVVLATKRFDDATTMAMTVDAFELSTGKLYALNTRLRLAKNDTQTRGRLGDDGKFQLTILSPGKTESQTLDWNDNVVGPYSLERSLRDNPLKPGEKRTAITFFPDINAVGTQTHTAIRRETTDLLANQKKELLRVEETSDKVPLTRTLWLDDEGRILKSTVLMGGLTLTSFRVTRAEALDQAPGDVVDLGYATLIKPDKAIPRPHQTAAVVYRLECADEKTAETIPAASYQKILGRDGKTVRIEVRRTTPTTAGAEEAGEIDPAFTESNGFIQSDDPAIVAKAKEIAGAATDPWDKATRLERWVDRNMSNRDFTIGFASAKEVMETLKGDCTEHAVLLAALCRAVGVPARVAMGLVYIESSQAFGYHMWTEVNVKGRWYPLDGTIGQGFVAGGHIKLADGSLKGASALSTFLPIAGVIGRLKIAVESSD